MSPAVLLAIAGIALFLIAVLAGYETAFMACDPASIRILAEDRGDRTATRLLRELSRKTRMIAVLRTGILLALTAGVLAMTHVFLPLPAALLSAPILLVFAEIIPKTIARNHANRVALLLFPFVNSIAILLAPLVFPVVVYAGLLRRALDLRDLGAATVLSTEEDFRHLVDQSAESGRIEPEEQEMIHSVMDLGTLPASSIMIPRIDIDAVPDTATRAELLQSFMNTKRTRIPVFRESIDNITGVANVYDVLLDENPEDPTIARFSREVPHVPDSTPVADLMGLLKGSKMHMVIVTDEYGGTDGLITLEDALEEIFGEIHDEHDHAHDLLQKIGPNAYVADARMRLEDLGEEIGVEIIDDTVETVGGWVMRIAGRIPSQGEKLRRGNFQVTILEGQRNQIVRVRLDILDANSGDAGTATAPMKK